MLIIVNGLLLCIGAVLGSGELTVLHHPSSLVFKGHDPVKESILKEVYSAALGFSTQQYSNWNGMFIEDPFNLAEAVVTVAVDGVADIGTAKGHNFPLRTDEDENEIFEALEKRVQARYPEEAPQLIRVNLAEGLDEVHKHDIFRTIKSDKPKKPAQSQLKLSVDEDRDFLREIAVLHRIVDALEASPLRNSIPDVFWFRVSSVHPLADLYGENSTQVKEAKQLLNEAIARLNGAVNEIYKGRVLVSILTSDASHTRFARSLLANTDDEPAAPQNLAKDYNPDYPVIFNIILWFGVAMVFSLLAICIAIAEMDPGRDSIIYRMTSTRLKKD